jgi:hypothetical protein
MLEVCHPDGNVLAIAESARCGKDAPARPRPGRTSTPQPSRWFTVGAFPRASICSRHVALQTDAIESGRLVQDMPD